MPDRSKFEELWKRMLPVYQALGPLKNRAVTVCEDNVQYPLEKVVEIANLYNVITRKPFDGDTQAQVAKLGELLDALQPVENALPRTDVYKRQGTTSWRITGSPSTGRRTCGWKPTS